MVGRKCQRNLSIYVHACACVMHACATSVHVCAYSLHSYVFVFINSYGCMPQHAYACIRLVFAACIHAYAFSIHAWHSCSLVHMDAWSNIRAHLEYLRTHTWTCMHMLSLRDPYFIILTPFAPISLFNWKSYVLFSSFFVGFTSVLRQEKH